MVSIPLAPSLVLGLLSFLFSAFTLGRIVLPILPPSSCYRHIPSKKFGLSSADISHAWLSIFDTFSLAIFLAQVVYQFNNNDLPFEAAKYGDSAARLWLALTTRQTCLLIILAITLLHVRLGRPTYFGIRHIYLWLSTIGMVGIGAIAAAALSIFGLFSLFGGIAVYLSVITLLATILLSFLATTLVRIKHNLEKDKIAQEIDSWPNPPPRKRRTSFTTDEVQAIKDRASWVTSIEGSTRRSLSPWSFATSHASQRKSKHTSRHSMPASFYSLTTGSLQSEINAAKQERIPPVPPLPSPYKRPSPLQLSNSTPADGTPTSWLTSLSGTVKTMSPFSFPSTRPPSLKSIASRIAGRQRKNAALPSTGTTAVFPVTFVIDKPTRSPPTSILPLSSLATTTIPTNHIVTTHRVIIWLAMIWLPFILTMPYLVLARANYDYHSSIPGILLIIAQTIPSPLLALSISFRVLLPIPSNLFSTKSKHVKRKSTATTTALPLHRYSNELQLRGKSGSYTVVEGRRSGDIWVETGQAVDGRSKVERMMSLLVPNPRLSILPLQENGTMETVTELIQYGKAQQSQVHTVQDEDVDEIALVPQRFRPMQAADSSVSATTGEESPASVAHVMTAQRYQPFPARILQFSAGRRFGTCGPPLSPPPASPLPPTPDESLEEGRSLPPRLMEKLAAEMLPILVPGLKVAEKQPTNSNEPTPSSGSESSTNHCNDIPDVWTETPHGYGYKDRSLLQMTPPDDQSTPHFRFPKHRRSYQSLPPVPGNPVDQPGKPNYSTPVRNVVKEASAHEIAFMPEDDTLTRKFNSLVRSLGSPETPSSGKSSQGTILCGILSKKSPVKPLVPRRTGGVTRNKSKIARYSPLKTARQGHPSAKAKSPKRPRDRKVLYNVSSIRDLRAASTKQASPEKVASPAEYIPAVNRLSAIITDYEACKKQPELGVGDESSRTKANHAMVQRQFTGTNPKFIAASSMGEFAQIGPYTSTRAEKENNSTLSSVKVSPFSRTDTAKQRTRLMQSQQLPTVRLPQMAPHGTKT
ncbi:hypothetical protein M408DRAFT_26361 [Serendipita vermifera MAFF 305830]|uniref:Uncharacterized protein n=1 Tax=Serendipita vermifera MAFF 305830 TaxID=933852 RepID=A0A0C3AYV5_SERVB|nr:hypothetical protein M408DRAFT_26361 [Serendipita vermifera MAFF 305830]